MAAWRHPRRVASANRLERLHTDRNADHQRSGRGVIVVVVRPCQRLDDRGPVVPVVRAAHPLAFVAHVAGRLTGPDALPRTNSEHEGGCGDQTSDNDASSLTSFKITSLIVQSGARIAPSRSSTLGSSQTARLPSALAFVSKPTLPNGRGAGNRLARTDAGENERVATRLTHPAPTSPSPGHSLGMTRRPMDRGSSPRDGRRFCRVETRSNYRISSSPPG